MDQGEVEARLVKVFRLVFDDDDIAVHPDMTADDLDGWDSATHIVLVVAVEREFGLRFSLQELEALHTVGDMMAVIQSKGH